MSDASPVLVTIPISHYCEKARWALEWAGVGYLERAHLQGFHQIAARRAGGGKTAPVLVWDGKVLAESAEIVEAASAEAPPGSRLYPEDQQAAAEVRQLEEDFDARLGPHARRWVYDQLRGSRDVAIAYGCTGIPAWQRRALPLIYPGLSYAVDRYLDITPATVAESESIIRSIFDEVAERLADGRPYLCGDDFTAADLTFAALCGGLVLPAEYGVPLPQPDELPSAMAANVEELRAHPAGAHAMTMFRERRHRDLSVLDDPVSAQNADK